MFHREQHPTEMFEDRSDPRRDADRATRLRELAETVSRKDAQIAQLAHDLALIEHKQRQTTARLLRQIDMAVALKESQIAQCTYHLRRYNASPWWKLGRRLEKFITSPFRYAGRLLPKAACHTDCGAIAERSYERWIDLYDTLNDRDRRQIADHIRALEYQPLVSIIVPQAQEMFRETLERICAQLYPNWELCIGQASPAVSALLDERSDSRIKVSTGKADGIEAANAALASAKGDFIALLEEGTLLAEQAIYGFVVELNDFPEADLLYCDEDRLENGRRRKPYFKTDWNPELFAALDLLAPLSLCRRALVEEVGGFRDGFDGSEAYDLALRLVRATSAEKIRHIPAVFCHRRTIDKSGERKMSDRRAKQDDFAARGEKVEILDHPLLPGFDRIRRPLPAHPPLVSLVVPTRNRPDLLGPCMDGLLNRTSYRPLEIILIDHQSDDPSAIALIDRLRTDRRVRVLRYEGPFNYSEMNNRAVAEAKGEIIGLVNNDIDVIEPDWLSEMVSLALVPENGAIGAKLLYPDGSVQHGGVILGAPWGPDHVHAQAERNDPGYFGRLMLTTNVSAVTGACLVLRKSVFLEVGGLNATDLAVAYNDVDLCLKIRAKGYRNVWTPFALLYHHEWATRGDDQSAEKIERADRELAYMRRTWGLGLDRDPYFNVNLWFQNPAFVLAFPPRRIKPWRAHAAHAAQQALLAEI